MEPYIDETITHSEVVKNPFDESENSAIPNEFFPSMPYLSVDNSDFMRQLDEVCLITE